MRFFRSSFGDRPKFVLENDHDSCTTHDNDRGKGGVHSHSRSLDLDNSKNSKTNRFSFSGRMARWSSRGGLPYSLRRKSRGSTKSQEDAETDEIVEDTLNMLNGNHSKNQRDSWVKERDHHQANRDMEMGAGTYEIPTIQAIPPIEMPSFEEWGDESVHQNTPLGGYKREHEHGPLASYNHDSPLNNTFLGRRRHEDQHQYGEREIGFGARDMCVNSNTNLAMHMSSLELDDDDIKVHSIPSYVRPHARVPSVGSGSDQLSEPYSQQSGGLEDQGQGPRMRRGSRDGYDWREVHASIEDGNSTLDRWDQRQLEQDIESLLGVKI